MYLRNCLLAFGLLFSSVVFSEVVEVDADGLKELMASGVTVIDVRTPGEWKQTGIVEGSIPIMFFDGKRKPRVDAWLGEATKYIKPDRPVAIICRTGKRSKIVGNFLIKQQGYQQVYNVVGGIKDWKAKGNKTVGVN